MDAAALLTLLMVLAWVPPVGVGMDYTECFNSIHLPCHGRTTRFAFPPTVTLYLRGS